MHYNTSVHLAIGIVVVYGRAPPALQDYLIGSTFVEGVNTSLSQRDEIMSRLKLHLAKVKSRMKEHIDTKRSDVNYVVGD